MSSDVEEYQEIVDTYTSVPSKNQIAPARRLEVIEYSRNLTKVQKEDKDAFNNFITRLNANTMNEISNVMRESIQLKSRNIKAEMERMKLLYKDNKEKMKNAKEVLKKSLKDLQQEEFKRGNQLEHFIDFIAKKELKNICFRAWKVYRNAQKFRKSIIDFCYKYRTRKIKDKCFNDWKQYEYMILRNNINSMITQWGIELKLKKKYEEDLNNYKEEYLGVIALLQENIKNVEDQILKKRQARKEFSFNLSRNLLKTISNLSMEVVSLNQFAIKDKDLTNELDQINLQVKQKLKAIEGIELKVTLEEEEERKESNTGIFSQNVTKSSVFQ